jgi:glycosyltransferase involved in cell wall biosynthesis
MKVLLLADILPNGGAERQLALLATNLPEQYDLRVLSLGGGPFVEYLEAHGIPVAVSERRGRFDPSFLPDLRHALTSWRPDIVHSWGWISTLSAGPLCRALGIPLVDGTIRTATPPREFIALKRVGMAAATLVIANSRAGLASWRVPPAKGRVIYNGFDASRLQQVERPESSGNVSRIVMVGRMEPEKDFATVIEAARQLSSESDGWRFAFVGEGTERRRLQAAAGDLVEKGVVEFLGGGIEVLPIVGQADVGILMTDPRLAQEGCSNALMEYMACGLPVVCGDGGGNPELVLDGTTGFVVPQRRPDAVADRLRELRHDQARCVAMGEAGRARVLGEFSVSKMVEEYRSVYELALRSSKRHGGSLPAPRPEGREGVAGDGLRVLMLEPYPQVRGPLSVIVPTLAAQLTVLGCVVETDRWGRHAEEESFPEKVWGRTGDLLRIVAHLKHGQFDILFVPTAHNWPGIARDLPLVLASRVSCAHRIIHFHGSEPDRLEEPGRPVFKALSRTLVRGCDAVLLLSEQERVAWTRFEPRARFDVVLNPFVPPARSSRRETDETGTEAQRSAGAEVTVLFVGRLIREKGVLDLIEAVRLIVDHGGSVTLLVAGSGPVADEAFERVQALGLGSHVGMLGHVEGDELQRIYDQADLLALPTYWAEGFPTVILEAMSAGLPVVTTRIRGAADCLIEGENVLFVPARHPEQLAASLRRLADDAGLRARMGQANRRKVEEFEPAVVAVRYLEIVRKVAGVGSGAGASGTAA